jgi:heat-inducible transcriptional repressor
MESANRRSGTPLPPRPPELGERHQEVLASIIVNYVLTGQPVASRTVARASADGVSSATVRNAMADLEEMGYISQPHTSAGRVPTDLGYRYYVDRMMARRPLGAEERRVLAQALPVAGETPDIPIILERAARLLAALSHHVGVVLAPRFPHAIMKRMDFVHLHGRKVLALFVSHSGMVDHRVIEAAEAVTQDDLNRINAFVRERFAGLTLPEIRTRVLGLMSEEKALYDRLLARALDLSHAYLQRRESEEGQILVEGSGAPAGAPGPADIEQMTTLFRAFESKGRLVGLLNACLEQGDTRIYIGSRR